MGRRKIGIDATPQYLAHPLAPRKIKEVYPDVKLVMLLRNPVDRAFSHYNHRRRRGEEARTFDDAIGRLLDKEECGGLADGRRLNWNLANGQFLNYLERGKYAFQIEHWLHFFPREQMLILRSEEFFDDPRSGLNAVCHFAGLDIEADRGAAGIKFSVENSGGDYESMSTASRERLIDYFSGYNMRLYDLLDRDFGW